MNDTDRSNKMFTSTNNGTTWVEADAPLTLNFGSSSKTGWSGTFLPINNTQILEINSSFNGTNNEIRTAVPGSNGTGPNLVSNPGFDDNNGFSWTPSGWDSWNQAGDSDYAESNGGAVSGSYHGTQWNSVAYQVHTKQLISGIPNGLYTMRAWVRSTGGQNYSFMTVKDFGLGSNVEITYNIGTTANWTQIAIPNINVTNGQALIGFYSDSPADKWLYFDNVEFFRQ